MSYFTAPAIAVAGLLSLSAAAQAGEFNNQCTTGLAMGQRIDTDCAINTTADGKTLCFGDQPAKDAYMKDPKKTLMKARQFWNVGVLPEFGGFCTTGLAMKKRVPTDCSVNAKFKEKTYCFGDAEARAAFMKDPDSTIAKAKLGAMEPEGL